MSVNEHADRSVGPIMNLQPVDN
ncbi:hypothetical protein BN381_90036 [Candidatus Microthrix parvicella RN1]|uniref:Uncharacterized protein n=1 Tax=Candidatus Neomicrothrix parvicella RN1 TaxID=1229780 RepID=R4Z5H9_9ACTN|nr:hypothetical protein BN381_90036 [Candidatus Microthrix parvicella RN1]